MTLRNPAMLLWALSAAPLALAVLLRTRVRARALSALYAEAYAEHLRLRLDAFLRAIFLSIAALGIAFALSGPQTAQRAANATASASDDPARAQQTVFIMLDVSSSMYARDGMASTRMASAVHFIKSYMADNAANSAAKNTAKNGAQKNIRQNAQKNLGVAYELISFTDAPALAVPRTFDTDFMSAVLDGFAAAQQGYGTSDFARAALAAQKNSAVFFSGAAAGDVLLFVSDGESHAAVPSALLSDFSQRGYSVAAVLVGKASGGAVPGEGGFFSAARPEVMQKIARGAQGVFIDASDEASHKAAPASLTASLAQESLAWLGYFVAFLAMCAFAFFARL